MVFAGNNTGGAFYLLDKLKGEEGREGKRKKSTTNQSTEAVHNALLN